MNNNFYIDIGNTLIKINYYIDNDSKYVSYVTKKNWTYDSLYKVIPDEIRKIKPNNIYMCSVVSNKTNTINKLFKKYWNVVPQLITYESNIKISLEIEHKKQIGADLIALACYLNSKTNNGIMVNLGTATTIIHVKDSKLMGVIICPGLWSSFNSLIEGTSNLNSLNIKKTTKVLGVNTEEALSIGILHGHSEMIKGLVYRIDPLAEIIISGGDALKINNITKYRYVKEATIEGIKIILG